ncbi:MAG: alanine racemase [Bacteroidetes bacterium]|nr:alanine racemase [Bacteroidota bacterium]
MNNALRDLAPARAWINLPNLRQNVQALKQKAPGVELIGVVKANAYGHGILEISKALIQFGIPVLAVATVPEAIQLREGGICGRILVFGAPREITMPACVKYDLEPMITGPESIDIIRPYRGLRVHAQVDTGMGRLGVQPGQFVAVLREIERLPDIELVGIWMHFATADDPVSTFARKQWDRLCALLDEIGSLPAPIHAANSAAIFSLPESVDPALIEYARVGISLYGLLDLPPALLGDILRPVMTLEATVSHVKTVRKGTPISYGCRWHAPQETRIATIAAGYADGYPRILSGRSSVAVNGHRYPVVGAVCMDMLMVDIGPPDGSDAQLKPGDEVILFGEHGPTAIELAHLAETIPYEIVCGIAARVPRIYVGDEGRESN